MHATAFDPAWLKDPAIFSVNQLPPCSDHAIYATEKEAEENRSGLVKNLDGHWRASFAMNPAEADDALLADGSRDEALEPFEVPGELQLQKPDWDPPHYVNYQYPWDGHEALVPPMVSDTYNPTVTCIRRFAVTEEERACGRAVLTFHGVEAAVAVWLNGRFVGYAEDSFTPHRFDVTALLHTGENRLAARVFKRCTGSWLEDQDFWRFSGIHRSVTLTFEPETHLADIFVRTPLTDDYTKAWLEADLRIDRPKGTVNLCLTDDESNILLEAEKPAAQALSLREAVPGVRLWNAEEPVLYTLGVILRDEEGRTIEVSRLRIGFRQFEMKDRIMCLNGKRIVFHGVNRHEFDGKRGRVMTEELLMRDFRDMKGMNVNAIRTCHYPNTSRFYQLCDQYGFYVIDETNIETHGTWARENPDEIAVPASRPEWRDAILARGSAMQERDKNHACVLLWSCGNESWYGDDLLALSEQFRRRDPTRLVHYEGCWPSSEYAKTSDVYSRMYYKAADIEAYLSGNPEKPFINCEYSHAMGNSCGGISLYRDLEDRYPMYQGGFIWDYVDQALITETPEGRTRLAYGGDFGDRPTDWQFNTNGIVLGDRTLTPKVQEVRRVFADVTLRPDRTGVTVTNRKVFAALHGVAVRWSALLNRETCAAGLCPLPAIGPGEQTHVDLPPEKIPFDSGEVLLTCELVVTEHPLLPKGHVLAFGQACFGKLPAKPDAEALTWIRGDHNLGCREAGVMIRREEGLISLRDASGRETLLQPPLLSLFRAPTDNDRGNGDALRQGIWHMVSRYNRMIRERETASDIVWRYENTLLPDLDLKLSMSPRADGLHVRLDWEGVRNQPDLPALGLAFPVDPRLCHVQYFGLGPEENYVDRCEGAMLGWHEFDSLEAMTRYCKPQESGNRRGVDVLRLTDENGHGIEVTGDALEISVLPYLPEELAAARHPDELTPTRTVLDVAAFRKGIGGDDSWGAPVLPQFTYPADRDYSLAFVIRGI